VPAFITARVCDTLAVMHKIQKLRCLGKMGAGCNNLGRKKEKAAVQGREEEGSSSNRPELAAFFLASWHADRGAVAVFVRQPVIVDGSH